MAHMAQYIRCFHLLSSAWDRVPQRDQQQRPRGYHRAGGLDLGCTVRGTYVCVVRCLRDDIIAGDHMKEEQSLHSDVCYYHRMRTVK